MDDLPTLQALTDPEDEPHDPDVVSASGRSTCANCEAVLTGRYCATCGQLDQPLRIPVHRFLAQSFVEFFGIDGRVWATLGVLLFKPGKLTSAYLGGQRRRYLRPLRVYLSSTLLFFFLLSLLDPVGRLEGVITDRPAIVDTTMTARAYVAHLDSLLASEAEEDAQQRARVDSLQTRYDRVAAGFRADSLAGAFTEADSLEDARDRLDDIADDLDDERRDLARMSGSTGDRQLEWQREQAATFSPDSLIRPGDLVTAAEILINDGDEGPDIRLGGMEEWLGRGRAYERLKTARTSEERLQAGVDLARTAIAKVPVVLFLMLPVFAFLLKLFYVRRGWYYSEHLVFGLHTHAFAFLVFAIIAALAAASSGQSWAGILAVILYVSIPVYFLVAQRRVYGQGWIKTLVKATLLGGVYLLVLSVVGLTLTILLAFLG